MQVISKIWLLLVDVYLLDEHSCQISSRFETIKPDIIQQHIDI